MSIWLTAILPVASALLGVLVANKASSQRDAIARLWERRADTYLAIFGWTEMIEREITTDSGEVLEVPASKFAQLAMPDELLTQMWVFASDPVRYAQGPCRNYLFLLSKPTDTKDDLLELEHDLLSSLHELRTVIRKELSEGKLTIPVTFRIRQRLFPVKRKANIWRNRRRARKRNTEQ